MVPFQAPPLAMAAGWHGSRSWRRRMTDGCGRAARRGRVTMGLDPGKLFPVQVQLAVRRRTVAQVQVDEALVRNTNLLGERLEVVDRFLIQADGDLLLQLGSIGILPGGGEVIFLAHETPSRVSLPFPGGRLAGRDDSDRSIVTPVAMANNQNA